MEYSFFLGCFIPSLQPYVESATRKVLEKLGVVVYDVEGASCCPPTDIPRVVDELMWITLAARNLALAEKLGYDVFTVCNGCFETLFEAKKILEKDKEVNEKVNRILSNYGLEYIGKVNVKNILEVLYDDVGLKRLENTVVKPLTNIKVCLQPGCKLRKFDEELNLQKKLKKIAEVIGCQILPYESERICCGFPTSFLNLDYAYNERAKVKLDEVKKVEADCIALICPACLNFLEMAQLFLREKGYVYDIPCMNLLELVALAQGFSATSLGSIFRRIRATRLLNKLEGKG
ncbi:MAG: CoB--CoM heterodisulfide reductase iron-sulfur subunit B family protein [Candidatus Bathyarchaeota archaeon]